MKIKNLSDKELKLPMKKSSGQKIIVILAPGQIVYSEAEKKHENKQLVIWERKKLIEITNDVIPQKLEYCHPYNTIKKPIVPTIALSEDFDDDQDGDSLEPLITVPKLNKEDEDEDGNVDDDDEDGYGDDKNDDSDEDDEDSNDNDSSDNDNVDASNTNLAPAKNKGGRPKGAKNKPKKKKSKRTSAKKPSNNNSDSNAI